MAPRELESNIRVDIHPSHLGDIRLQPSQIDLQARQGRFQVQRFDVETSMARMRATGAVDLSGRSDLQYELTANLSNLRQLLDEARLDGDVRLQGQATGEWPDLTARGTLDVRDVQYQEYALDALRLTYEASDLGAQPHATTQLRLQRARLGTVPLAQVELQGAYDGAARQVRFEVNVDQSPGNGMSTQGMLTLQETGQRWTSRRCGCNWPNASGRRRRRCRSSTKAIACSLRRCVWCMPKSRSRSPVASPASSCRIFVCKPRRSISASCSASWLSRIPCVDERPCRCCCRERYRHRFYTLI